jgi:hypothetical protein
MNPRHGCVASVGALLIVSALIARSAEAPAPAAIKATIPQTAAAKSSAELLARAERAFNGFVAACASGDAKEASTVTMRDLQLETQLDEPHGYPRLETRSMTARCRAVGGRGAHVSNLWIYPTNDVTSVFVQYTVKLPGNGPQAQLALMEMRGERISRLVTFADPPSRLGVGAAASTGKQAKNDPS